MDLEEKGINMRNWVDSAEEELCECGIEPPGSISHGVSYYCYYYYYYYKREEWRRKYMVILKL